MAKQTFLERWHKERETEGPGWDDSVLQSFIIFAKVCLSDTFALIFFSCKSFRVRLWVFLQKCIKAYKTFTKFKKKQAICSPSMWQAFRPGGSTYIRTVSIYRWPFATTSIAIIAITFHWTSTRHDTCYILPIFTVCQVYDTWRKPSVCIIFHLSGTQMAQFKFCHLSLWKLRLNHLYCKCHVTN